MKMEMETVFQLYQINAMTQLDSWLNPSTFISSLITSISSSNVGGIGQGGFNGRITLLSRYEIMKSCITDSQLIYQCSNEWIII